MALSFPPPASWPLILCGPILRRVTDRSVCVWVALSAESQVTLRVYEAGGSAPLAQQTASTLELGQRLHVLALDATMPGTSFLQSGRLYEYDLSFASGGAVLDLDTAGNGLLGGLYPLGYATGQRPSFALPPAPSSLNIVHGSCRMPHAPGYDMLAAVDGLVQASLTDPLARPHQLLMTGDQIYADDVAVCVLDALIETAGHLLGWQEPIALPAGTTVDDFKPGIRRGDFLWRHARLTSTELDGHLFFLGDYYAMYLFAWSDVLWPRSDPPTGPLPYDLRPAADAATGRWVKPSLKEILSSGLSGLTDRMFVDPDAVDTPRRGTLTTLLQAEGDRANARLFARTLPLVRRVLANVPTLMQFDDHEITDDWNLNRQWDTQVRGNPYGRRVLRNGLAAYAVFQDWGNHPEHYGPGTPGAALFDELRGDPATHAPRLGDVMHDVLDLSSPANTHRPRTDRICWDWQLAWDGHRILALDTRTWREFPAAPLGGVALMGDAAMDIQVPAPTGTDPPLTLVISPAPVLGFPFVEEGLQRFVVKYERAPFANDNEPWGVNRRAFERLLARLASHREVVVLSGDVHYAFTNHCAYFPEGGPPARIVQLCASSLKKENSMTRLNGAIGSSTPRTYDWLGWNDAVPEVTQRLLRLASFVPPGDPATLPPDVASLPLPALFLNLLVADRFDAPAVLPAAPWGNRTATSLISELADGPGPDDRKTQWRYRVKFARQLPAGQFSTVVGPNNIARITFPPGEVWHEVFWLMDPPTVAGQAMPPAARTLHKVPRDVPSLTERPSVQLGAPAE